MELSVLGYHWPSLENLLSTVNFQSPHLYCIKPSVNFIPFPLTSYHFLKTDWLLNLFSEFGMNFCGSFFCGFFRSSFVY
jgi:hypothetical protein